MAAAAAGDIREYRISNRYLGFALIAGISGALTWGEGSMAERSLFAAAAVIYDRERKAGANLIQSRED